MSGTPIRRVVLATNPEGRSYVAHDGPAPVVHVLGAEGHRVTEIWGSDDALPSVDPADPTPARTELDTDLDAGVLRFRVCDFPAATSLPPLMHSTTSIEYTTVLSGSVRLLLEEGSVDVHAGDTIVQLGNLHAWEIIGPEPCRLAFVSIGLGEAPEPGPGAATASG